TDITNVASVNAATSHPHIGEDGTIYNIGSSVMTGMKYHVFKTPPKGIKAIFRLIDRKTGSEIKTKYVTKAFFFFHHINTYEEDGHLVTDVLGYTNPNVLDILF
ncbi:beta-carotene dioxygenase, putative, partial [Trichonephila inaurata madagascariensis]